MSGFCWTAWLPKLLEAWIPAVRGDERLKVVAYWMAGSYASFQLHAGSGSKALAGVMRPAGPAPCPTAA